MNNKKQNINLVILFLAMFFCQPASAGIIVSDPLLPDTLWIESAVGGTTAGAVSVDIMFVNDQPLRGLEVVLTWDNPEFSLLTFSFAGGRVEYIGVRDFDLDSLNRTVIIHAIPFSEPDIAVGRGLLGTLYFNYPTSISPGFTYVDSISLENGFILHSTAFSDTSSENSRFIPQFRGGEIELLPSCCIGIKGNINGSEDDKIDIRDLTALISYIFKGGIAPPCPEEADLDGSNDGVTNILDLTYFINYVFKGGPEPASCF